MRTVAIRLPAARRTVSRFWPPTGSRVLAWRGSSASLAVGGNLRRAANEEPSAGVSTPLFRCPADTFQRQVCFPFCGLLLGIR
jgi:hypothetical protein